MIVPRSWFRGVAIDADRLGDATLGGDADLTMSQSLGLAALAGKRWALIIAPVLSVLMSERHHAVRSLYGDTGLQLFPDRMPVGAPAVSPHPEMKRFW